MAYYDIPTLPDGWGVSTNIESHISFVRVEGETRYSIAVYPTEVSTPSAGWTVMGLAQYEPFSPVFTDGAPLEEALSVSLEEMNAKDNGEQLDHVRKAGDNPVRSQPEERTVSDDEEVETDNQSTDGQSGLDRWV